MNLQTVLSISRHSKQIVLFLVIAVSITSPTAHAVTIDMVTVGNHGNAPDTRYNATGFGSVAYAYQIGKYEVTTGQYTEFLNAVAKDDPNGLYNVGMGCCFVTTIQRSGSSPNFSYSIAADWADRPVSYVSFWDAARFANWLHNGQPTGAQGPGTTEDGAYHDVGNLTLFGRNTGAVFFIPTENEWYKAGYHDKTAGLAASYFNYPTGTNSPPGRDTTESTNPGNNANNDYAIGGPYYFTPVGEFELSASPYGTFDQGGNVWEWNETKINSSFVTRGGAFDVHSSSLLPTSRTQSNPTFEYTGVGFRVASIPAPEPSTLLLLCFGSLAVLWRKRGLVCIAILAAVVCAATSAQAVTIDMVTVGNPGNAPDTRYDATGFGRVNHVYQIGKYEVTAGQYTEFLNAVAKADPNGLYSTVMGDLSAGSLSANIQRSGSSPNYSYSVAADWASRPVNYVSFWDAARFANWLHNGQPTGAQGPGTTENGAYHDVGNQTLFGRNAGATFFIPTEDEWYKAAYHDKTAGLTASYFDYPTGTNSVPGNNINESTNAGNNANYVFINSSAIEGPYYRTVVGEFELSDSPYGTFDQGGNVREWNETALPDLTRGLRGGSFDDSLSPMHASWRLEGGPASEEARLGFRVAGVVPEPASLTLSVVGMMALIGWRGNLRITGCRSRMHEQSRRL